MKIAIVGTGKMGSLLAERLAGPGREILLIGREPLKTYQAAREAGCRAGTLEMAAGAAVVILALPAAAVLPVAKQLEPYLGPGTLLVNIATSAPTEPIRQAVAGRGVKVAGVRFIGHALETRRGEIPILAVATDDEGVFSCLSEIFAPGTGGAGRTTWPRRSTPRPPGPGSGLPWPWKRNWRPLA